MRSVVKISGKIITPERVNLIAGYVEVLSRLAREGLLAAIVVGGGRLARSYIDAARRLGLGKSLQDLLGIDSSRLNAKLLALAMSGLVYPEPVKSVDEAVRIYYSTGKPVVAGGFQPGQSTAAVAMLLAEALGAGRLVLATTVDAVYDKDPSRYRDAKRIQRLSYTKLREVLEQSLEPGHYELLDEQAISIGMRSGIETLVVYGYEPKRVEDAVRRGIAGSVITV